MTQNVKIWLKKEQFRRNGASSEAEVQRERGRMPLIDVLIEVQSAGKFTILRR